VSDLVSDYTLINYYIYDTVTLSGPQSFTLFKLFMEDDEHVKETKFNFKSHTGKLMVINSCLIVQLNYEY